MLIDTQEKSVDLDGLILIDCWEPPRGKKESYTWTHHFYEKLVFQVQKYRFDCVVNHSGELFIDYTDRSTVNLMQKYLWDWIGIVQVVQDKNQKLQTEIVVDALRFSRPEQYVSNLIKYTCLNSDKSILLQNIRGFYYHWNHFLKRKPMHWLVAGQTWQYCVHTRALGLSKLARFSRDFGVNFYATDYSFLKQDGATASQPDFERDSMHWIEIPSFGYQLRPAEPDALGYLIPSRFL